MKGEGSSETLENSEFYHDDEGGGFERLVRF